MGMVLLSSETANAFEFALKSLLNKSRIPSGAVKNIISDFDTGIRRGFGEALPDVNILKCCWHAKKYSNYEIRAMATQRRATQDK